MIHAAGHINMRMPHYMYIKIATALNRHKKSVNGSKILFLGVAYKPDIDDDRESPALEIMDIVKHKGGDVAYHDPYIPVVTTKGHNLHKGMEIRSVPLTESELNSADCVVLTTNHEIFDVNFIIDNSGLIVDMRNMIKNPDEKTYKL